MIRFGWMTAALVALLGCGGSTSQQPATPSPVPGDPSAQPTVVVDAGAEPESRDASIAMDAAPVDAGPPAPAPPTRTQDYYLRWRFDPAPVPEGAEATYSHVVLEVHSQGGVQEVDTDVTDANCVDDTAHVSRRGVLRAKCWFAGAGWEIEVLYRDSTFVVRRRAVDEAMNRNPQWRAVTRIEVPARSTVETPAGPYSR